MRSVSFSRTSASLFNRPDIISISIQRTCKYGELWPQLPLNLVGQDVVQSAPAPTQIGTLGAVFPTHGNEIDPFRHETLRKATVDSILHDEAIKVLGSLDRVQTIADDYFNSIHHRMSILSKWRFYERLQDLPVSTPADFMALCLTVLLIQQRPLPDIKGMQSSLYVSLKSIISLLEAVQYQSLEVVQCRLLLIFYEMGHGMFPAASISIGACSRLARFLGINKTSAQLEGSDLSSNVLEERKRAWWAILNLDR